MQRFDLRDWTREAIEDSKAAKFECAKEKICGEGSAVSARLIVIPKEPVTVERQRTQQAAVAKRMREQSDGRYKSVDVSETRETKVESIPLVFTEKRVTLKNDKKLIDLGGVMTGRTRAFIIISTGSDAEKVRANFQGFARIVALMLDQMAAESALAAPSPPAPAQEPKSP